MGGGNYFSIEAEINRHEIDSTTENSSQTPISSTDTINFNSLLFSYNRLTVAHEGSDDEHTDATLELPESAYIDTGILITEKDLEKAGQLGNDQADADDISEPAPNEPEDKPKPSEEKSAEKETSSTVAHTDSSNDNQNSSWLIWLVSIITVLATLALFAFLWIRFKKNKIEQKP